MAETQGFQMQAEKLIFVHQSIKMFQTSFVYNNIFSNQLTDSLIQCSKFALTSSCYAAIVDASFELLPFPV